MNNWLMRYDRNLNKHFIIWLGKIHSMKSILSLFILTGIIISCHKEEPVCNVDNPSEELTWLKDIKNSLADCLCETSII